MIHVYVLHTVQCTEFSKFSKICETLSPRQWQSHGSKFDHWLLSVTSTSDLDLVFDFYWAISGLVQTTVMFVSRWESNFVKYCRTCMLLTDSSRACLFSSSSFCLLILSFSALASAMAVRKESMIPKKSSGLFCEGSSPKNSHTESNFWRIKEEQRF